MVAIMCNGKAGNKPITRQSMNYKKFERKLEELCSHLAKLIVSDGEDESAPAVVTATIAIPNQPPAAGQAPENAAATGPVEAQPAPINSSKPVPLE